MIEEIETMDIREALLELERIDKVRDYRRKIKGISYYVPNPMQLKAHQSKARIVLFCGGNRSGKSKIGRAHV